MKKLTNFTVMGNEAIAKNTYALTLSGDCSAVTRPGQFVNIEVPDFFLRRPFSVCRVRQNVMTVVYKVVGGGTLALSEIGEGGSLDVLTGLGNGFDIGVPAENVMVCGGGAGVAPLFGLAEALIRRGKSVTAFLGFNTESEIFLAKEMYALGVKVFIATADGSAGVRGLVTDAIKSMDREFGYVYACGPEPMLRAVYDCVEADGEYSFEERMGCGFGACMGCSCKTKYGSKRICVDGPVLKRGEILW